MSTNCPACGADNRDGAHFCDQCGASLAPARPLPGATQAPVRSMRSRVNWVALLVLALVLAVLGWLLIGGPPREKGRDDKSADPHGAGDLAGDEEMGSLLGQLDEAKAKLANDPLDTESLAVLYRAYGMIGRQDAVRPHMEAALVEFDRRAEELGGQRQQVLTDLVGAAIYYDPQSALLPLLKYRELEPESLSVLLTLGSVYESLGQVAQAREYYEEYVDLVDPDSADSAFWEIRVRLAHLELDQFEAEGGAVSKALLELQEIATAQPELWEAWLELGRAYKLDGDLTAAEQAWIRCVEGAADEATHRQAQAELAELLGAEAGLEGGS